MADHSRTPTGRRSLSRRQMLQLSATVAAGSVLAACAPSPTATAVPASPLPPTPAPVQGTVVLMHHRPELSEDEEKQFEADNPGIQIELLEYDYTRFFAMYAAGTPPDLLRVQAPSIPQFLARKLLYDLTPYFADSSVLKPDDLAPANNYYKANSPL